MLTVTAYTGGRKVPSARFRVRQYIPELRQMGVNLRESPSRFGSYPPTARALRPAWGMLALAERFHSAVRLRGGDVTLLQREMLSTLATVERYTKPPRVLDVDDAIWLLHGGAFAVSIARCCEAVICGNSFIADFFRQYAPRVVVLPTPVDTDRYRPAAGSNRDDRIICWSGTSSSLRFVYAIEPALAAVLTADSRRRLRIVCDAPPSFQQLPAAQVEFVQWSETVEVSAIQNSCLAIMPLDHSAWSRGKCSYKLLTYMACGLPVVATPVGMNVEVLSGGRVGLAADTTDDWAGAINSILESSDLGAQMGVMGRQVVTKDYSLAALAPRLAEILHAVGAAKN